MGRSNGNAPAAEAMEPQGILNSPVETEKPGENKCSSRLANQIAPLQSNANLSPRPVDYRFLSFLRKLRIEYVFGV